MPRNSSIFHMGKPLDVDLCIIVQFMTLDTILHMILFF